MGGGGLICFFLKQSTVRYIFTLNITAADSGTLTRAHYSTRSFMYDDKEGEIQREERENDKQVSCGKRDRIRLGNRVETKRRREKRRSQRQRAV